MSESQRATKLEDRDGRLSPNEGIEGWAQMLAVAAFHKKNEFFVARPLQEVDASASRWLRATADTLTQLSKEVESGMVTDSLFDIRLLRAHLPLEEMGELLEGLAECDEVKVFDALVDLLYVIYGAGVTFDLPLPEGFLEVARSNMTKERQPSDPSAVRLRDKGPNYIPPDLKTVLNLYRHRSAKSLAYSRAYGGR